MFRRTSHCAYPPNTIKINSLNSELFQNNVSSNDFLMHSPPLPPRTIKNNFSATGKKFPISKNSFSDWNEKTNCYDKKVQCNCSRPRSCPAEESSFILTPPIPPKTCTTSSNNSQGKSKNHQKAFEDQSKKPDQIQIENRKSSRHRNSEKGSSRKKSRSNSRSVARDDKSNFERLQFVPESVDICVNKYLLQSQDVLGDRNLHQKTYHKPNELCKICENNEQNLLKCAKTHPANNQEAHQPDLISDQPMIISAGGVQLNKPCSNTKFRNKWKAKFSQFWSKSKKPATLENSPTPPSQPCHFSDGTPRPRRSKSLHLIPDNSLSPGPKLGPVSNAAVVPAMQSKASSSSSTNPGVVTTATGASIITKNSSIFAVISPSTSRWKRNLFCISPKTGSSSTGIQANKKSDYNLMTPGPTSVVVSPSNQSCMGGQRNPPSSVTGTGGRISPVHLIPRSTEPGSIIPAAPTVLVDAAARRDKDVASALNLCKNQKSQSQSTATQQEKSEVLNSKGNSGSKSRNRIHHDNLNKPSQTSTLNQPVNISNSPNQICPCSHSYHYNDNHFSCNNAYSRFCTQFPCLYNNPSCQIYNIDFNTNVDMVSGCSQVCPCRRNLVHFSPNHFHCCHSQNSNTILCSSCRIPLFCTSCSYNCYNSNSKPCTTKQSICHHSTSPPPCLSRQLPPPPPPPANVFSSGHHFPRRNRQSYSKTPPPSFHTHQHSCHDDHCYQEYNQNFNHDNCQKVISNKSRTYNFSSAKSNCCCQKSFNNHCYFAPHSKCSGCGSFIYDELSTLSTPYNMSGFHKNQFSNTPAADSLLEIKWRNTEQGMINQCRLFTSSVNNEESTTRVCCHNHCSNRQSGTCGHYSNEFKTPCCRNREKLLKRRKSSSHSCHGSNIDPDNDEKHVQQHELSRTHFSSPVNNLLPTNSAHISPDLNQMIPVSDLSVSTNTNLNINSANNFTSSTMFGLQMTSLVDSSDKFEPWRKTFKENMLALRNLGWYWGPLNHLEAENLVENRPDGTFLVRDSAHDTYFLSLTFRVLGTTYHTRIEYSQGKFSFWSQPESHSATTIVEFIDKAVAHSASGKFHYFLQTSTPGQPPMEVSLLYPLSRYQIVQSLQHLSRFVILSNIRKDHVSQLQLPSSLKAYLLEKQYYIDNIETFVKLTKDADPLVYEPSRNSLKNIQFTNNDL